MSSPEVLRRARSLNLSKRVGKYYVGRTIGEGTYAKVKYGQHAETGEAVAIKVLDKEQLIRSGMTEQIKREITILKQIRHPHIVNLLEVMSSRDTIFMVMELVTGGDLFDRVVAHGPMKEPAARRVFSQLLDAVGYCHQQGIYHRDLKPENVLLDSDGHVKLSDFGLGALPRADTQSDLLRTTCGTPNYVAPEVLAKKGYRGGPADVWSLGVVLYVMLAGCLPFDEDDLPTLFAKVMAAQCEVPPWLSADAVALLGVVLNPDPAARPTAEQLWQHPWMRTGLARHSGVSVPLPAAEAAALADDILAAEDVQPEEIQRSSSAGSSSQHRRPGTPASPRSDRRINAFELIKSGLDISALFEARDDVVTRHTRFSTKAPLDTVLASIESAAVGSGGRVEREEEGRMRLYIPQPRSGTMQVLVELWEVLPGTHVADLQKVRGNTAEFHAWYADLTHILAAIISKKAPGRAGDVGAQAAAARRREEREAGGRLRVNAFELIASSFNVGAIFEEEQSTSRHVQFSSRLPPGEILDALESTVAALGGSAQRRGNKRTVLSVPVGTSRSMRLQAHLFEVLPGVHVCQIEKDAGSSLDFMRVYGQLASRLQHIMMKRSAFPTATHAGQLLRATPSMTEEQRRAVEEVRALHRDASSSASLELRPSGSSGGLESASQPQVVQEGASAAQLAPVPEGDAAAQLGAEEPRRLAQQAEEQQQKQQRSRAEPATAGGAG
ncbi:CBL-interacting serine threonine- kinase 3-like [Chlorella sorokiniana]|uniref:non-specific serine/threonine protein kinase n=1 Tax=Chlorella sorokiniana TaxID=3076 RepID=A0A2P6TPF6_CHLSO|nr:CBL-interacting serine threonine- kinase 3-like [Chlorella sorokiniana]|eukprot:PRW55916.1 CBL-interacting serine threonine- kinase 3-like [Chlorella sorokiniana]